MHYQSCGQKKKSSDGNKLFLIADIEILRLFFIFFIKMSANKKLSNSINLTELITNIPIRKKLVDQDDRDKFEWNQVCI
jgi:hypothetical protein